jgi:FkbM family methyltransferase
VRAFIKKIIKKYIRDPRLNKKGVFSYYRQQVFFPENSLIFKRTMAEGGIYELDNLKVIHSFLKPDTTLFDVGANIGMMAIPLLWNEPTIHVVSIEASPNSLNYLKKTHAASTLNNRWTIIDKAVSDKPGIVDFHLSPSSMGALDGLKNTNRIEVVDVVKVDCTTLDIIWAGLDKPAVSFIKIDIEGADLLALKGGIECINFCRPVILIEWNQTNIVPFGLTNYDLMKFVGDMNYELYYLPETKRITSLVEFNILCKKQFIENYLLIPAERKD